MDRVRAPIVLTDDDPVVLSRVSAMAQLAGRSVADGWSVPAAPWDLAAMAMARVGSVSGPDDEEAAVTLALRHVAVIVGVAADQPDTARLRDALSRVGSVHDWRSSGYVSLSLTQIHLLHSLANGASMPQAARSVHVSLRTAHRRVADARENLRVTSTAAATNALLKGVRLFDPRSCIDPIDDQVRLI